MFCLKQKNKVFRLKIDFFPQGFLGKMVKICKKVGDFISIPVLKTKSVHSETLGLGLGLDTF